jgi:hypothetical protein
MSQAHQAATEHDSRHAVSNELSQPVKEKEVRSLFPSAPDAAAQGLAGTGFTYRHDWGNKHGQWKLNLNWGAINCNSRVFVSASEFSGGNQCDFMGAARYTVHNVSPQNGVVSVWLEIAWDSDIRVHLD